MTLIGDSFNLTSAKVRYCAASSCVQLPAKKDSAAVPSRAANESGHPFPARGLRSLLPVEECEGAIVCLLFLAHQVQSPLRIRYPLGALYPEKAPEQLFEVTLRVIIKHVFPAHEKPPDL